MSTPTNTTTTAHIQATLIAQETMALYEKYSVFDKLVGPAHLYNVPQGVRTLTIAQQSALAFAATTEATAQGSTAFQPTPRQLTPITIAANILESWETPQGTPLDTVNMYAQAAARGYTHAIESQATISYAAHYGEAVSGNRIGTNAVALSGAIVRQGIGLLLSHGAPGPYNYVVDPIQFNELMANAEFRAATVRDMSSIHGYAATIGVSMDRYLGNFAGVHVWVGNGMINATGRRSMMFGQGALGRGYKQWYTDANPTPAQLHVSKEWQTNLSAHRIWFRSSWDVGGLVFTSTTNNWVVDIVS